jgi:hypothetical protein
MYQQTGDPNKVDTKYWGSSSDDTFKPFVKIILRYYLHPQDPREAEQFLHIYLDVVKNTYFANRAIANIFSFLGCRHTPEAIEKIKEKNKGRKVSEKTKNKISEAKKGRKDTQETRNRKSEAQKGNQNAKGNKLTDEHKLKISNSLKGKKRSDETKQNKSNNMKGNKNAQGHKHTDETKKKIRNRMKGNKNAKRIKPDL